MRHIVAALGIHPVVFTQVRRPEGHGKIEALNRLIRSAFLSELRASRIKTLDALNEAFLAWADLEYNRRVHGETGDEPLARWRRGVERVRYVEEEAMRQAFLWREERTPDKAGVFSLFGQLYQCTLGRRRIEVRFDPEGLDEVEVWLKGRFVERVKIFEVSTHRRPHKPQANATVPEPGPPLVDWLGHLVARRDKSFVEPTPRQMTQAIADRRARDDQAIVDLFADRLDEAVFCEVTLRDFLARFGPIDIGVAEPLLDGLLAHGTRPDQHIAFFLDALRQHLTGGIA